MTTSADVRALLVHALRDDLIGPDADDPRDREHLEESLSAPPSHWYLTGFLAPTGQATEDKEDPTADEQNTSALDGDDEGEPEQPVARRPVFPSSIGLSVLCLQETRQIIADVSYGTYAPGAPVKRGSQPPPALEADAHGEDPGGLRQTWTRTPHDHQVTLPLDGPGRFDITLPDSGGVTLRGVIRPVPETELPLVPPGTRYVTVFLVNDRKAHEKPEVDRGFIFQAKFSLTCADGFHSRPNLRGARPEDDHDEKLGDLHYRDAYEYGVGHGIAAMAEVEGHGEDIFCGKVSTCWVPTAEVEKVSPCNVDVELRMEELAQVPDGEALWKLVSPLVADYNTWITRQAETDPGTPLRRETQAALLQNATVAARRIEDGVWALRDDPQALEAFRIANRVMAAAAWQRNGDALRKNNQVPTWRPFQLAFLLMNVVSQIEPIHAEREAVDLIFFPTGGGKTEAYLGLAAFTLALRRLKNPGLLSAGVTVLMRYTLRLLTLDQLERAATLICALELERRKAPEKLGPQRFSIGLWVGKAATPNRFGTDKDRDETTARNRVLAFAKDPKSNPSPIPLDKCPWCGTSFSQNTFDLLPNSKTPERLRAVCTKGGCPFRSTKEAPDGIPIVAVDDEIYRELPCFLIATVDKFAALPWVGRTGLLLGKNVTHHDAQGFYGPAGKPPGARPLAQPLLPPDLIIQDELHLISGPLGTIVGLYETAIDHLTTRVVSAETGAPLSGQARLFGASEAGGQAELHLQGPASGIKAIRPKIIASTATVRRAHAQIRALFGRSRVDVFPPPGPNRRHSFFAETVPAAKVNARLYVGLAAPGRSQKVLLMRSYIALLGAAKKAFAENPEAADPYMTLVGYFNSLRELGGSQRIVEDEVRARLLRASLRRRAGETTSKLSDRRIQDTCEELTSRKTTDQVKEAKARLERQFTVIDKKRDPVDVALASNMISVGVDITRLGLMVVCSQPKTTAEYIQATSRVGRDEKRPGLVVTLLNVHKPRDRSHFEHFVAFHESFYRGVEATSVTPFAPRAIDRGLVAVMLSLARLGDPRLTGPDGAADIEKVRKDLGFLGDVLAARVESHREQQPDDTPIDETKAALRARIESLLDAWVNVAQNDPAKAGLAYQKFEGGESKRPLLHMPLDPELENKDGHERRFQANRSMRDVEETVDVYVTTLKSSMFAKQEQGLWRARISGDLASRPRNSDPTATSGSRRSSRPSVLARSSIWSMTRPSWRDSRGGRRGQKSPRTALSRCSIDRMATRGCASSPHRPGARTWTPPTAAGSRRSGSPNGSSVPTKTAGKTTATPHVRTAHDLAGCCTSASSTARVTSARAARERLTRCSPSGSSVPAGWVTSMTSNGST